MFFIFCLRKKHQKIQLNIFAVTSYIKFHDIFLLGKLHKISLAAFKSLVSTCAGLVVGILNFGELFFMKWYQNKLKLNTLKGKQTNLRKLSNKHYHQCNWKSHLLRTISLQLLANIDVVQKLTECISEHHNVY